MRRFGHFDAFGFALKRAKITIVDVDTPDERVLADALTRHGPTPIVVRTQGGNWQAWYRNGGERRRIRPFPELPIDILGNGYVVAPPSAGAKGSYSIVQGTLDDLARLPIIQGGPANENRPDHAGRYIAEGRRNDALFRHCMREAHHCEDFDQLLDLAVTFNENCTPPLPPEIVTKTARSAWSYTVRGDNWFGGAEIVAIPHDVVDHLATTDPHAYALLSILKRHHRGRDQFVVASGLATAMEWDGRRFLKARRSLEACGLIRCIHPGGRGPKDPPIYGWTKGYTFVPQ